METGSTVKTLNILLVIIPSTLDSIKALTMDIHSSLLPSSTAGWKMTGKAERSNHVKKKKVHTMIVVQS